MQWLLVALAVMVIGGFVAYDLRVRLPSPYLLKARAAEACAALPKPGREGRYQSYPACPWAVSVRPKQVYSGIIQPGEHGALFVPGDYEPGKGREDWSERYLLAPRWAIRVDEQAIRSVQRLNPDLFDPFGGLYRVKLRGWRTARAGQNYEPSYGELPHVLFADEFISVEPVLPEG